MKNKPMIGIITGTYFANFQEIPFQETRYWRTKYGYPSAPILVGQWKGVTVAVLQRHGERHQFPPNRIPYRANAMAFKEMGVEFIIGICAVGSLQNKICPGHVIIPDQFYEHNVWGRDTCFDDDEPWVHMPIAKPYCEAVRAIIDSSCRSVLSPDEIHRQATVVVIQGEEFSTIAESSDFTNRGFDIINMTNSSEAKSARKVGLCYGTLAFVSDDDSGKGGEHTQENTIEINKLSGKIVETRIKPIILTLIERYGSNFSCGCASNAIEKCDVHPPLKPNQGLRKPSTIPPFEEINGKIFHLKKERDFAAVRIYESEDAYLRIGPKDLIVRELKTHKAFAEAGLPVAELLSEGEKRGEHFFIEKSLGTETLVFDFERDFKQLQKISDTNFQKFLSITERIAIAQANATRNLNIVDSFPRALHLKEIIGEHPRRADAVLDAYGKIRKQLAGYPEVLSQGDYSAVNLLEHGVIDFERACAAPFGYDLATAIYHVYFYPSQAFSEKYKGKVRRYKFTHSQFEEYISLIDRVCMKFDFPEFSDHLEDFIMARAIMFTPRLHKRPALQIYAYARFKRILEAYLTDKNVIEVLLNDDEHLCHSSVPECEESTKNYSSTENKSEFPETTSSR
jgi:5'-methylthioadenosine phosphorylase